MLFSRQARAEIIKLSHPKIFINKPFCLEDIINIARDIFLFKRINVFVSLYRDISLFVTDRNLLVIDLGNSEFSTK